LLSGALFWLGGYLLALIGPIACFWFFARSWEKQPRRRALSFVQNHSLSMLVMVLYCVLLGCSVCVGGPIYLGFTFGKNVGLITFGVVILLTLTVYFLRTDWRRRD
jgi:hypothetical protein